MQVQGRAGGRDGRPPPHDGESVRHSRPLLALIHSPLVGTFSWLPVAEVLQAQGWAVAVPALEDDAATAQPYWQQHSAAVRAALAEVADDRPLLLIGHSGAGPLLPALRAALPQPVVGYLFVDAGLPQDGASPLDLLTGEAPTIAAQLRELLEAGGRFPNWDEQQLRATIPAAATRGLLLAELRPRDLRFFVERLPVFGGWPDAPCGYLQLSPAYEVSARQAQQVGWPVQRIAAGHFHALVDPAAVAALVAGLVEQLIGAGGAAGA